MARLPTRTSKRLLLKLLAYRALGRRNVRLPRDTAEHWNQREAIQRTLSACDAIRTDFLDRDLYRANLISWGHELEIYTNTAPILNQFIYNQYCYENGKISIKPRLGDSVIDAGGCYGDTALYFAEAIGEDGHVFSFEFMSNNLKIFGANLDLNQRLKNNIDLIQNPLWSSSNQILFIRADSDHSGSYPAAVK